MARVRELYRHGGGGAGGLNGFDQDAREPEENPCLGSGLGLHRVMVVEIEVAMPLKSCHSRCGSLVSSSLISKPMFGLLSSVR